MPIEVSIGFSAQRDIALAAKECVLKAKSTFLKSKIDLVLVFTTSEYASEALLRYVSKYLGLAPILGSTTTAIITNKGILKHGLAIMLLGLPENSRLTSSIVNNINELNAIACGNELGENLLAGFKNARRDLSIIFSDGLMPYICDIVTGLQQRLGASFPLIGSSASDDLSFKKTLVFFNQTAASNSSCGILLGGKLSFGCGTKHGWRPLGKPRIVTKSKGNTVIEIDNEPAAKIYESYFNKNSSELQNELKYISVLYPIGINIPGEQEYLLRNITSIEKDGSIICQGNIPEQSKIRLMIGTKETCLEATREAAKEAKKGLFGKPPKFALVFNSVSRYILLGRQAAKELEIIKEELGEATPLIGIYTYGEQAPLRSINYLGKTYFHNQTITILTIGG